MNKEIRDGIINAVDEVVGLQGMAEPIADLILLEGTGNVTEESLTSITFRPEGSDRDKSVTSAGAKRVMAAIKFFNAMKKLDPKPAKRSKRGVVEKFLENTTETERRELALQAADLRINFEGDKPLSWSKIRLELNLKNDEFHKVIRVSDYYHNAVESFLQKRISKGWNWKGDVNMLAGFSVKPELTDDPEKQKKRIESEKTLSTDDGFSSI